MPPILLAAGSNASAQLSIGHSEDVHSFTPCQFHHSVEHLLPGGTILDLASASTHALLLLRDATGSHWVLGAGKNTLGQLEPRCALWDEVKPEPRFKPVDLLGPLGLPATEWTPVKIAVTWTTSFVVYRQASFSGGGTIGEVDGGITEMVIACGSNDFGELGKGGGDGAHVAITEASDLPSVIPLCLEQGDTVELLRGGQRHVLAVIRGYGGRQRVMGWGASRKGELDPSTSASSTGPSSNTGVAKSSKAKGKGKAVAIPPTSPPTLLDLSIPAGVRIVDIALGSAHSLALLSNGSVIAWGSDVKGQITDVHRLKDVHQIAATWGGSYFLRVPPGESPNLISQGANNYSQLLRPGHPPQGGIELPPGQVRKLVAGSEHLMLHVQQGALDEVWVGGWNEHGNLGLGDSKDRDRLTCVDLSAYRDHQVHGIWGGCAASWIWLDNSTV